MKDQYQIDFEKYSLQKFFKSLRSRDMIPSRKILKDDLDNRFKMLHEKGITNLKEIVETLKTKQKIDQFSKDTGLDMDYLILLNREVKSYHPNPIRLDKFSGIEIENLDILNAEGIKNTRHMINRAGTKKQRIQLSETTGIPLKNLDELAGLSDLSRAYGVGPVFARMIYDIGIRTIKDFAAVSAEEFVQIYEEKTGKKADFGAGEIQFSLDLAKELELIVEI